MREVSTELLGNALVLLDEADQLLFNADARDRLALAKGVIALSASFGGDTGIARIKRLFPRNCSVHDVGMKEVAF